MSNGLFLSPDEVRRIVEPFILDTPVLTNGDDVKAWNGIHYPHDAPDDVKARARECDFFKYRGHGLNQLTHYGTTKLCAGPALMAAFGKSVDQMTYLELDRAFLDPRVYLFAFRRLKEMTPGGRAQDAISEVVRGQFAQYGTIVSGDRLYGPGLFTQRCTVLRDAMLRDGVQPLSGGNAP